MFDILALLFQQMFSYNSTAYHLVCVQYVERL